MTSTEMAYRTQLIQMTINISTFFPMEASFKIILTDSMTLMTIVQMITMHTKLTMMEMELATFILIVSTGVSFLVVIIAIMFSIQIKLIQMGMAGATHAIIARSFRIQIS